MARDKAEVVEESEAKPKRGKGQVAKKSHVLHQNEFHFDIVEGEPLPDGIPKHLMTALETEGVI